MCKALVLLNMLHKFDISSDVESQAPWAWVGPRRSGLQEGAQLLFSKNNFT